MNALNAITHLFHRLVSFLRKAVRTLLVMLIRGYQFFISPYFPTSCRYHPTCSNYALEAIKIHGALKGIALTAWRILRCHPWSAGGEDPVPEAKDGSRCKHHHSASHEEHRIAPVPSTTSNDL